MEANTLDYKFVPGVRKNSKLLYVQNEQQIYKLKSVHKSKNRYTCYEKSCPVTVFVDIVTKECGKLNNKMHNHPNQEEFAKKLEIMNSIKTECKNVNLKRNSTREIFDEECQKNPDAAHLVQYGKMKRNLCYIKTSELPKNPACPQDIKNLFGSDSGLLKFGTSRTIVEGSSLAESQLFYRDTIIDSDFAYTIFMSPSICEIINSSPHLERNYLLDATFNIVPRCGYKQLLIVHISYLNHTYPFIYVLMTNKSEDIYNHLFQYINNNLFQFNAVSYKTDFEKALRNSLSTTFPSAKMTGCWFHYCNSLKKNARKIMKFTQQLKRNRNATRLYKKFLVLPLLPAEKITIAFNLLKEEATTIISVVPEFKTFIEYFERQWMQREGPSSFSVYKESIRTTSSLEGYHSQLSKKIETNGNFCKFLNCLLDEDFKTSVELKQSINGTHGIYQRPRQIHQRRTYLIEKITKNYTSNKITLNDFFNQMSNWENKIISLDDFHELEIEEASDVDSHDHFTESQGQITCIICFTKPRDVLLMPCNHFKLCTECYAEHSKRSILNGNTAILCPVCRQIVQQSTKIFV